MLPQITDDFTQDFSLAQKPDSTFKINTAAQTISGEIAQLEAVKQAIYLILCTERYDYLIHSWDFGVETQELYGCPSSYCLPELKRCIKQALLQDDRITDVSDFKFETHKKQVLAQFTVSTIYGTIQTEKAVDI